MYVIDKIAYQLWNKYDFSHQQLKVYHYGLLERLLERYTSGRRKLNPEGRRKMKKK